MQWHQGEQFYSRRRFASSKGRFSYRSLSLSSLIVFLLFPAVLVCSGSAAARSQRNSYADMVMSPNNRVTPAADKKIVMPAPFYPALRKALKKRKTTVERICPVSDPVARRILEEYGAIFLADKKVLATTRMRVYD